MYWVDAGTNKIETANLDGSDRKTLININNPDIHPFDIGVFNGTMLWTDWKFQKIVRTKLSNPSAVEMIGNAVFFRAGGMHIQFGKCYRFIFLIFFCYKS